MPLRRGRPLQPCCLATLALMLTVVTLALLATSPTPLAPLSLLRPAAGASRQARILCCILTHPDNFRTRARAVRDTWAQRCDGFFFLSAAPAKSQLPLRLPIVQVHAKESRDSLWQKMRLGFEFIHDNHLDSYDFFLKADDDSYIILENLRHFLRNVSPSQPLVAGRRFRPFTRNGYMSGGGSYVLSRDAVRRLVRHFRSGSSFCRRGWGPEDVNMGRCLESAGVQILDSIDDQGRERFHPLDAKTHVNIGLYPKDVWLWNYNYHPMHQGLQCCSDSAISFHYISPMKMLEMHYLIYQLRAHGVPPDSAESPLQPRALAGSVSAGNAAA